MKNILLVNPWIADFAAYDLWAKPLGLMEVAGRLRGHPDLTLDLLDCLEMHHPAVPEAFRRKKSDGTGKLLGWKIEKPEAFRSMNIPRALKLYGIPEAAFAGELERRPRPDAVLVTSGMTYQYPGVQRAIQRIRKQWKGVPVLLGGIYATLCAGHACSHSGADTILPGPAGLSLETALSDVLGTEIRLSRVDFPAACGLLSDVSSLPFLTTRGCPYHCTYCASRLLQPVRAQRPVEACLDELRWISAHLPTRHIAFYDDALLWDADRHAKPLFEGIGREGLGFAFHAPNGLQVKAIDAELAVLMRRAKVQTIRLSVETTSARLSKRTGTDRKMGDLALAAKHLEKAGYRRNELDSYLLIGLPGQTSDEIQESVNTVAALGIRSHYSFFSPIPGTALWGEMAADGLVHDEEDPLLHNKVLFPYRGWSISPDDLARLKESQNRSNAALRPHS